MRAISNKSEDYLEMFAGTAVYINKKWTVLQIKSSDNVCLTIKQYNGYFGATENQ